MNNQERIEKAILFITGDKNITKEMFEIAYKDFQKVKYDLKMGKSVTVSANLFEVYHRLHNRFKNGFDADELDLIFERVKMYYDII